MPKVSVIMASYNHDEYVAEAIQSILDQNFQDFEIIITDDGSTDGTVSEIQKFSDPRIQLYCFENNRGQFAATNHCLEKATGEYVSVLNSDDAFLPRKLEKQVKFLDDNLQVGAVFSYAQIISEKGKVVTGGKRPYNRIFIQPNRSRFEWLNHFFSKGNCLCHPSVLIRKECHETAGYYDMRFAQLGDLDLWVRLCMKYEIHIIEQQLVQFRRLPNSGNRSSAKPESNTRSFFEYRRILDNYLNIRDVGFLYKVFPEARKYGNNFDAGLIPFVLAMIAVDSKSNTQITQAFALDTIANLLSNRNTAKKLAEKFGFSYIDFIKMAGKYDVFNINKIKEIKFKLRHPLASKLLKLQASLKKRKTK